MPSRRTRINRYLGYRSTGSHLDFPLPNTALVGLGGGIQAGAPGPHVEHNCAGVTRGAGAGASTSRSLLLYMLQRVEAPSTASPPAHSRAAFFSARKHQLESTRERSRTFLFPSAQSLSVSLVGREAWSVEKTAENEW
jgi:hypothetical protein